MMGPRPLHTKSKEAPGLLKPPPTFTNTHMGQHRRIHTHTGLHKQMYTHTHTNRVQVNFISLTEASPLDHCAFKLIYYGQKINLFIL